MLALTLAITAIAWSIAQRGKAQLQRKSGGRDRLKLAHRNSGIAGGGGDGAKRRPDGAIRQTAVALPESNSWRKRQSQGRYRLLRTPGAAGQGAEAAVRIERLRVVAEAEPERYRYRLLVGFVANKQVKDFKGRLQLAISYSLAGRDQLMTLPGGHESPPEYGIEVRHFLRKEGVLPSLPGRSSGGRSPDFAKVIH